MNIKDRISLITDVEDEGKRIDKYLNEELEEFSRTYLQKLMKNGNVSLDNGKTVKPSYKIIGGESINIDIPEDEELMIEPKEMTLNIVYEDNDIVVINKEAGVVVHPAPGHYTDTLVNGILYHIKDLSGINGVNRPGIVHRLDKDTSGLIIIAKNDEAHKKMVEMFAKHLVKKTYIAIVKGKITQEKGRIETLIGRNPNDRKKMTVVSKNGKNAITNYIVLDTKGDYSFLKVNIETGRTHQIRVHMKYINRPIVGDEVYGRKTDMARRQMLHAYRLEFLHPINNKEISICGDIPNDFENVMRKIDFDIDLEKI